MSWSEAFVAASKILKVLKNVFITYMDLLSSLLSKLCITPGYMWWSWQSSSVGVVFRCLQDRIGLADVDTSL